MVENIFQIPDDHGPVIRPEEFLKKKISGGLAMPDHIAIIGSHAFFENDISEVHFSNNLEEIGEKAFCNNKISTVTLPDSMERIEADAFALNPIQHIVMPADLIFLADDAFHSIRSLETVKFNLSGLTLDLTTILSGKAFRPTNGDMRFVQHKGWQEMRLLGEMPDHNIFWLVAYSTKAEIGSFLFKYQRDIQPDARELAGTSRDDDKTDSFCRGDVFRNYFSLGQLEQKYGRLIEYRVLRQNITAAAKQIQ